MIQDGHSLHAYLGITARLPGHSNESLESCELNSRRSTESVQSPALQPGILNAYAPTASAAPAALSDEELEEEDIEV